MRTLDKASDRIRNTDKPRYAWEDKAGGYGIQEPFGMLAVKEIRGDYYNIVGLPISRVYQDLKRFGVI